MSLFGQNLVIFGNGEMASDTELGWRISPPFGRIVPTVSVLAAVGWKDRDDQGQPLNNSDGGGVRRHGSDWAIPELVPTCYTHRQTAHCHRSSKQARLADVSKSGPDRLMNRCCGGCCRLCTLLPNSKYCRRSSMNLVCNTFWSKKSSKMF